MLTIIHVLGGAVLQVAEERLPGVEVAVANAVLQIAVGAAENDAASDFEDQRHC
jgi:hypothetical protein